MGATAVRPQVMAIVSLCAGACATTRAGQPPAPEPPRRLAVYAELTSSVVASSIGASVAYRPLRRLAFSAGAGGGHLVSPSGQRSASYAQVAIHGLFGGNDRRSFEIAGGVAGLISEREAETRVLPAFFLGYRWEAWRGAGAGRVLRFGLAESYGWGLGLDVSLGASF